MNFLKQKNIIILFLVSIPFIFLSYMLYAYSVDIPSRDEWVIALLLDKYYHGTLTWYDLFVQHNEHRLFFPYLIMIPTAIFSKWDVRYWIIFNVIFGLGIFIALFWQTLSTAKIIRNDKILWLLPLQSVLVFSLRQYDSWLMGFQIIVFMSVLCTIGSIFVLARLSLRPTSFIVAVFLGFVGSFSFANGMLIWPIGFFILLLNHIGKNAKKIYLIAWILISASVVLLYLYNYQKPAHHPSLLFAVKNPLHFFGFVFSFLASPFISTKSILAPLTGLSGAIVLFYAAVRLWQAGSTRIHIALPYLALGLYSILNAIIIAVGRGQWGIREALNSKYVTHAIFFWIALTVVLFLVFNTPRISEGRKKSRLLSSASFYVIIGLTLLATSASFNSIPYFFDSYIGGMNRRTDVLTMGDIDSMPPGKLTDVYLRAFGFIREHHMSVFREK
jgi:hypothetical protein